MAFNVLKADDQPRMIIDNARVRERKPVSVESDIVGMSNLFYVGLTWTEPGGVIETASRKGFEVITFVVEGGMVHKNSLSEETYELKAGSVQVIRSASGISHTETLEAGTRLIQIWLDPDFRKSLQRSPLYAVYHADEFETESYQGMKRLDLTGDDSPVWFSSKATMELITFTKGKFKVKVESGEFISGVVISGELMAEEQELSRSDFFTVGNVRDLKFEAKEAGSIFLMRNPKEPGYKTYTSQLQLSS